MNATEEPKERAGDIPNPGDRCCYLSSSHAAGLAERTHTVTCCSTCRQPVCSSCMARPDGNSGRDCRLCGAWRAWRKASDSGKKRRRLSQLCVSSVNRRDDDTGLRVPYGLVGEAVVVPAHEARKGVDYRCPACKSRLTFRAGEIRVWHFAHRAHQNCSNERALIATAKLLLPQVIARWKAGEGGVVRLLWKCNAQDCWNLRLQELPSQVAGALPDFPCPDGSIAPVMVVGPTLVEARAVVEFSFVGGKLPQVGPGHGVHWLELDVEQFIENPLVLRPLRDDLNAWKCGECTAKEKEAEMEMARLASRAQASSSVVAEQTCNRGYQVSSRDETLGRRPGSRRGTPTPHRSGVAPPVPDGFKKPSVGEMVDRLEVTCSPSYHVVVHRCLVCGAFTLAFNWPQHQAGRFDVPPEPRPWLLRLVEAGDSSLERHWANSCHSCGATQHDVELHTGERPRFRVS